MIGLVGLADRKLPALIVLLVLAGSSGGAASLPAGLSAFVRDHHLARYSVALVDLNRDGRPEALVHAIATTGGDAGLCGTGGCDLYVLSLSRSVYRQVGAITLVHPPIRVLPTVSHGWHDPAVRVAGGGILPGYTVRLRFDGRRYPANPTVAPAIRLRRAGGRIVIPAEPSATPPR